MDFQGILDNTFNQLNQCRLHPKQSAAQLINLQSQFSGNLFKQKYKTRQGSKALQDLIQDLQSRQPAPCKLKWSFALHMVADEQANLLGQNGLYTLQGTPLHQPLPHRARQYAVIKGRICEVCEFGGRTSQEILEELLIDDGLASRKRRNTLLDPTYRYIGIGSAYHSRSDVQVCTVVILAQDLISLVAPTQNGYYLKRQLPGPQIPTPKKPLKSGSTTQQMPVPAEQTPTNSNVYRSRISNASRSNKSMGINTSMQMGNLSMNGGGRGETVKLEADNESMKVLGGNLYQQANNVPSSQGSNISRNTNSKSNTVVNNVMDLNNASIASNHNNISKTSSLKNNQQSVNSSKPSKLQQVQPQSESQSLLSKAPSIRTLPPPGYQSRATNNMEQVSFQNSRVSEASSQGGVSGYSMINNLNGITSNHNQNNNTIMLANNKSASNISINNNNNKSSYSNNSNNNISNSSNQYSNNNNNNSNDVNNSNSSNINNNSVRVSNSKSTSKVNPPPPTNQQNKLISPIISNINLSNINPNNSINRASNLSNANTNTNNNNNNDNNINISNNANSRLTNKSISTINNNKNNDNGVNNAVHHFDRSVYSHRISQNSTSNLMSNNGNNINININTVPSVSSKASINSNNNIAPNNPRNIVDPRISQARTTFQPSQAPSQSRHSTLTQPQRPLTTAPSNSNPNPNLNNSLMPPDRHTQLAQTYKSVLEPIPQVNRESGQSSLVYSSNGSQRRDIDDLGNSMLTNEDLLRKSSTLKNSHNVSNRMDISDIGNTINPSNTMVNTTPNLLINPSNAHGSPNSRISQAPQSRGSNILQVNQPSQPRPSPQQIRHGSVIIYEPDNQNYYLDQNSSKMSSQYNIPYYNGGRHTDNSNRSNLSISNGADRSFAQHTNPNPYLTAKTVNTVKNMNMNEQQLNKFQQQQYKYYKQGENDNNNINNLKYSVVQPYSRSNQSGIKIPPPPPPPIEEQNDLDNIINNTDNNSVRSAQTHRLNISNNNYININQSQNSSTKNNFNTSGAKNTSIFNSSRNNANRAGKFEEQESLHIGTISSKKNKCSIM